MVNDDLLNYILKSQKRNISKEEILKALLTNGWDLSSIEDSFNNIKKTDRVSAKSMPSSSFFSSLEKYYIWIGLGGIIASGVSASIFYKNSESEYAVFNPEMYIGIFAVIMGFIGSFILFTLTKILKINKNNYNKALFFSGIFGFAAVLLLFLDLLHIHIPSLIGVIIPLVLFFGSFILLKRLYSITLGKAVALGMINIVVVAIISMIIIFILTLVSIFSVFIGKW